MRLATFIAKRYLFAKKSHNVINIISMISATGIAVGCAALIIVLSIYNGFDELVRSRCNDSQSDLLITPSEGKYFSIKENQVIASLLENPEVEAVMPVVEDNVFVQYSGKQSIAVVKGVDSVYALQTEIDKYLIDGEFVLYDGSVPNAIVGATLAQNLKIHTAFISPLEIYFPKRVGTISVLNPLEALNSIKVFPRGIFTIEQNLDQNYIYIPLEKARELFDFQEDIVTSLEVNLKDPLSYKSFQNNLDRKLGSSFVIKNRLQQNDSLYKVLQAEKLAIYLILIFMVFIISCNVFGSLSMLIIEKKFDIEVLRSMGADNKLIRNIFVTEGWLISLLGIVVGVSVGTIIALLQQHLGIVKMPGNFIVDAYPVLIKVSDILLTVFGVGVIGYLISRLPLLVLKGREQ